MKLDNKGVLLLEQVVSVLVIAIMSTMIFTALVNGADIFVKAYNRNEDTVSAYNTIETDGGTIATKDGTMTFSGGTLAIGDIEGEFYYEDGAETVGDFIKK